MTDYSKQLAEELGWSELFAHGMERGVPTLWAKCVALLEASAEKDGTIARQDCENRRLTELSSDEGERADIAEKELSEARAEMSVCDDIVLNQPLANCINELQRAREAAEKENAELLEGPVSPVGSAWGAMGMIEALKKENAELRDALDTIAGFAVGNGDVCEIIAKRARAALAAQPPALSPNGHVLQRHLYGMGERKS